VGLTTSTLLNGTTYTPLKKSLRFFKPGSMTDLVAGAEQFIVQMEILDAWEVEGK